ncbi:MAG: hypothetical protein JWQ01_261 [Massilia sp.]|nr:hypothetical protein [Massilia sp.]
MPVWRRSKVSPPVLSSSAHLAYAKHWLPELRLGRRMGASNEARVEPRALDDMSPRRSPCALFRLDGAQARRRYRAGSLRLLKRGFSTYSDEDRHHLASEGKEAKRDIERDRRLDADEEVRILEVLNDRPDERAFFLLALESAMRMRECYTLDTTQISLAKRTIHLDRTMNGDSRQVPLTTPALQNVQSYTLTQHTPSRRAQVGCSRSGTATDL